MTLTEAIERVKAIEDSKGDCEIAHAAQDDLYLDFIKYVGFTGSTHHRNLAAEILKVASIDFPRHCA